MFSKEQRKAWSAPHLKACHWYVEMNPKETPPHEEENLKSVEPLFIFEAPLASVVAEGPNQRATRGSKSKEQKDSKGPKSNAGKRVASTSGKKSSKCGKAAHGGVVETAVEDPVEDIGDDIIQSDSKNDAAGALIPTGTVGVGSVFRRRLHFVDRSCSIPIFTKIINKRIADFLNASNRSEFDTAVLWVRSQFRFHTHYSSC